MMFRGFQRNFCQHHQLTKYLIVFCVCSLSICAKAEPSRPRGVAISSKYNCLVRVGVADIRLTFRLFAASSPIIANIATTPLLLTLAVNCVYLCRLHIATQTFPFRNTPVRTVGIFYVASLQCVSLFVPIQFI